MTAKPNEPSAAPVRIDAWLWSTRFFKTRAEATKAVKAGHVLIGDKVAKPSSPVVPGPADYRVERRPGISLRNQRDGIQARGREACGALLYRPFATRPTETTATKSAET